MKNGSCDFWILVLMSLWLLIDIGQKVGLANPLLVICSG
jgi:hypothetical protein